MAGSEGIMDRLGALGEAADTVVLPLGVEAIPAAGDNFMCVGLMAHIPDDAVGRGVEAVMECQGQLHTAKVRGKMAAGLGNGG